MDQEVSRRNFLEKLREQAESDALKRVQAQFDHYDKLQQIDLLAKQAQTKSVIYLILIFDFKRSFYL